MNVSSLITSSYLNGQELGPTPQIYTVSKAKLATFDDGSQKVALGFQETEKPLTLNKTRLRTMMAKFGPETEKWIGHKVMLYGQELISGRFAGQWTVVLTEAPDALVQQAIDLGGQVVKEPNGPGQGEEVPF